MHTSTEQASDGPVHADPTQRFIPFRRRELVDALTGDGLLDEEDARRWPMLVELCNATLHHEFHGRLEALKDAYAPFDPDPDTLPLREIGDDERAAARDELFDGLAALLEDGNFEAVTEEDLHRAFTEESLLRLRLEVDQDDFERVLFFRRGLTRRREEVSSWWGLRRREVVFTNYEKVLMLVTFKDAAHFEDPDELAFEPGSTILKLFQDVPRADLEMLYPNAQPRMRPIDKLLIGVPAAVGGLIVLFTKALTTIGLLLLLLGFLVGVRDEPVELDQTTLVTLGAGLGSLGGYLVRQVNKFKNRKLEFLKTLADSLYFRNLDNDAGVLHHLVDDAEEEEAKETLLAWHFLRADGPATPAELDRRVERWLAERCGAELDFEVDDGLAKLERLGLAEVVDGDRRAAVDARTALARLDQRWDDWFDVDRHA